MRYKVEAQQNGIIFIHEAASESNALDIIDDLNAAGFAIVTIKDQDGKDTPSIDILSRLLDGDS